MLFQKIPKIPRYMLLSNVFEGEQKLVINNNVVNVRKLEFRIILRGYSCQP